MSTYQNSIQFSARITVECQSPLAISADEADPTLDNTIVLDGHGMPTIPGTSIAGVLRSLYRETHKNENEVFGKAEGKNNNIISRFETSFGFIHNENNQPVKGAISTDIKIGSAPKLVLRDQVALNEYGTVKDIGKFDKTALPKGTRFSFQIGLKADNKADPAWQKLLELLKKPMFRLGGLTHRGFGQLKLIALEQKCFDFKDMNDLKAWQDWQNSGWKMAKFQSKETKFIKLNLQPEDFWRVGDGTEPLAKYDKAPDALPYTENAVQWQDNKATETTRVVMPATGIKGALRHRTLFHLRKIKQDSDGKIKDETLAELFGLEAGHKSDNGQVGSLIINDIFIEKDTSQIQVKQMMHNKIDRFTGGTIDGALFSEELIYNEPLNCEIYLKPKYDQIDSEIKQAFELALRDLGEGRLALGAGSSKGHGYFEITNLDDVINQIQATKFKE